MATSMVGNKPGSQHSEEQVVLDEVKGRLQVITLNNPHKMNIISREVADRLAELFEEWEKENDAEMMIIKGVGRAFCAGGDLRGFYYGKAEKQNIEVIYKTYCLYYRIHTNKKTLVALVNGIVMGGGASLAILSTYKVVTEKTVFAAPEVGFGFHTESGLSYILSHLSGHLGEYLALTGSRLDGVEMIATGLGTHYIPSEKLEELEKRLIDLNTGDKNLVKATIEEFTVQVQLGEKSILHNSSLINQCFSKDTVEDIMESLATASDMEGNEWVKGTIKKLKSSSPIALKMTLRSVRQARKQTLFECLKKEFRLTVNTLRGLISNDLYEGIQAFIIEKDNSPKWNPPLGEVTEEKLNLLFKPLEEDFELQLPIKGKISRWEGKYENSGYNTKYPHDCEVHTIMTQLKSRM